MATTYLARLLVLAALWWALTGAVGASSGAGWLLGGPVIAAVAAWRLREASAAGARLRPWRLPRFVPFFLWRSFIGSCDVAWRALHWRLPIAPSMQTYTFRLPLDDAPPDAGRTSGPSRDGLEVRPTDEATGKNIRPATSNAGSPTGGGLPARVFFANCVNLFPGTLAASWKGDELQVHVLTPGPRSAFVLRQLEDHVASLFGCDLAILEAESET